MVVWNLSQAFLKDFRVLPRTARSDQTAGPGRPGPGPRGGPRAEARGGAGRDGAPWAGPGTAPRWRAGGPGAAPGGRGRAGRARSLVAGVGGRGPRAEREGRGLLDRGRGRVGGGSSGGLHEPALGGSASPKLGGGRHRLRGRALGAGHCSERAPRDAAFGGQRVGIPRLLGRGSGLEFEGRCSARDAGSRHSPRS